jgi:hypothetical protein
VEEILQTISLVPAAVGLFQSLLSIFGDKNKAHAVAQAAIAHPSLTPNVQTLLSEAVSEAYSLAA